jgi:hypothetical protein
LCIWLLTPYFHLAALSPAGGFHCLPGAAYFDTPQSQDKQKGNHILLFRENTLLGAYLKNWGDKKGLRNHDSWAFVGGQSYNSVEEVEGNKTNSTTNREDAKLQSSGSARQGEKGNNRSE